MRRQLALTLGLLAGPVPALAEVPFRLGVQTHFEQGWSLDWIDRAAQVGAPMVRDELDWAKVEPRPGSRDFAVPDAYMVPLAARGIAVVLVETGSNPLHDGGKTVHSAEGRAALAAYLRDVAAHYGPQLTRIEIGNEVNAKESTNGPFNDDAPRALAALAREVRQTAAAGPRFACAGTNAVAIGFLRALFLAGALDACDTISVHPYGAPPETVDLELARLRALMAELGGEKPIDVTEFGQWTDRPEDSPGYLVKMVAVLAAAGVADAVWYALADEPWWPNMGLFSAGGEMKPAGRAFAFVQSRLLPLGRPVDRSPTRAARIFVYGDRAEAVVAWGADLPVSLAGRAEAFDASGAAIPLPDRLTDEPVILLGQDIRVMPEGPAIVDSLFHYDRAPFSYFARRPGIGLTPLEQRDWEWASFRGAPDLSPLSITARGVTTARFGGAPFGAVERFTAAQAGRYRVSGWWKSDPPSEPATMTVLHTGQPIAQGQTGGAGFVLAPTELALTAGDTLDFELSPEGPKGDSTTRRRFRIEGPLD